ncbi:MAG: hypothetical protein Ta2D_04310 [Rickettsiales bacterium]|nr:MAG: hypothetical protein Ta2D_04310 [Rickettsiales bacterium]
MNNINENGDITSLKQEIENNLKRIVDITSKLMDEVENDLRERVGMDGSKIRNDIDKTNVLNKIDKVSKILLKILPLVLKIENNEEIKKSDKLKS